ncbi:ATP-binding cassette domain-containing protein [Streptomyces sp. NPDC002586]
MSVRYDGAPSDALREASARIPAGARVAVVGESGAGKSTLMKALVRFLEPSAGRLLVDGVDVRGYDAGAYRRRVATVPQDVFLFRGTVRDAIAYGVPGASPAEVEAAARAVGRTRCSPVCRTGTTTRWVSAAAICPRASGSSPSRTRTSTSSGGSGRRGRTWRTSPPLPWATTTARLSPPCRRRCGPMACTAAP